MHISFLIAAGASLLLAACGGGGGGEGTPLSGPEKQIQNPGPAPVTPTPPSAGQFAASVHSAPAGGAILTGPTRLEVRGSGIRNVELLPAAGYTPMYGRFTVNEAGTVAVLDWDTAALSNGEYAFRISAFDAPPGAAGAQEIVAMPARTWNIAAGSPAPAAGNDPLYAQQWHLKNTGQRGLAGPVGITDEDINVEPVWQACSDGSCRGQGVNVAVVDSGVEIVHPDLSTNMSTILQHRSYSPTGTGSNGDPTPLEGSMDEITASHGTMVAGIIAARDGNNLGGRGVAPRASIVSYAMLNGGGSSVSAVVDAMRYQAEQISASNNSWGAASNNNPVYAPSLWEQAIDEGLNIGRNGLGTIYIFANGNGAIWGDSSNYDEMPTYKGVLAVASVNAQGRKSIYSERGANIWISAPGGEMCDTGLTITTTDMRNSRGSNNGSSEWDLGDPDYTQCMNGTSSAAPAVTGVVALMLQVNPSLTWRDVRYILAVTARRNHTSDAGWVRNGAGRYINDSYGFGVVDAKAAVDTARSWMNMPALRPAVSRTQQVNRSIPDNSSQTVTGSIQLAGSNISQIEWVDVHFDAYDHLYSGDLEITLISPSGTRRTLAQPRVCYSEIPFQSNSCTRYAGFRFGVSQLLDEPADGEWRLIVRDGQAGDTGTFRNWGITVYGR